MLSQKLMIAALKKIAYPDLNIKKTYLLSRAIQNIAAFQLINRKDYCITKIKAGYVPVTVFRHNRYCSDKLLIFFHGGGWVLGSEKTYSDVCCNLAKYTSRTVVYVDYRLAPENKFPCAPEDCYNAAKYIYCDGLLNAASDDIALVGDSAGGNLAAAVSLMARDRGDFLPKRQILIYPVLGNDYSENSPFQSVAENGRNYLLTADNVRQFMELYRSCEQDLQNPYFSPLAATDLRHQPKTLIITAEYCPLRDEGEAYGRRLEQAGNNVKAYRMENAIHGFFSLPVRFEHVKRCLSLINNFLKD